MAYTPKTWANGDLVDAADMNHIEEGVAAASTPSGLALVATSGDAADLTGGALPDEQMPVGTVRSVVYNPAGAGSWPSESPGITMFSGGVVGSPPVGNAPGDLWAVTTT